MWRFRSFELVAYEPEDTEKIIKFLMKGMRERTVNTGWRFFFVVIGNFVPITQKRTARMRTLCFLLKI